MIEIRAGAGGDEASLFAAELMRAYQRYADLRGWKCEHLESSPSEVGGFKEVILKITGDEVFRFLKYESGVHRVQRVPATETQGRVHTSTVTVAVLPEAEEVDVEIKPEDLRIEVCRAGGAGGQHVNRTESAVQIFHLPTGIYVRCEEGRSQIKNKELALQILRSKLYEQKLRDQQEAYSSHRRSLIGSGDRSEKIRTYNFPQVARHRPPDRFHLAQSGRGDGRRFVRVHRRAPEGGNGRAARRGRHVRTAASVSILLFRSAPFCGMIFQRGTTPPITADRLSRGLHSPPLRHRHLHPSPLRGRGRLRRATGLHRRRGQRPAGGL